MRQKNTLTGIEGVIAGGVATANAPVGRRIHALKIFYTESGSPADVLAKIEYVLVRIYFLKEIAVGSGSFESNFFVCFSVDQNPVWFDVTVSPSCPLAYQLVILVCFREWLTL